MKPTNIPLDELEKIPLFSGLRSEELQAILAVAHYKRLLSGGFYYQQDDPAECMYVLIKGQVKHTRVSQDGKQSLIEVIKPIRPFGLAAMVGDAGHPVSAQAGEDSSSLYWSRYELMQLVVKTPQMAINGMRIMAGQLHELQDRFHQVTTQKVEQRLAHMLIRLAAQSGKRVKEGILIDLGLTRQDLAEMVGTTLYTTSRMISQWEGQQLVVAGREKVIIRNPHGLIRIIEGAMEAV